MHFIVPFLALLQGSAQLGGEDQNGLLGAGANLVGSLTIAGVMWYWLQRENTRRDAETKDNKDLHGVTHNKIDDVRDGYHGLKEELIRNNRVNGTQAKA